MEKSSEQSQSKDISYTNPTYCQALALTPISGEKKKRLMREKEVRAAESQAIEHPSPGRSTLSKAKEAAAIAINIGGYNTTGRSEAPITNSRRVQMVSESDLCHSVTKEQQLRPPVVSTVRKVRTMFPFDLSDPFKFRGTHTQDKNEKREIVYAYCAEQKSAP
jgi:hypothetical protein